MTYGKKRIPLLYLLIICIFARPVPQMLPLKEECTSFSKFSNNWLL